MAFCENQHFLTDSGSLCKLCVDSDEIGKKKLTDVQALQRPQTVQIPILVHCAVPENILTPHTEGFLF